MSRRVPVRHWCPAYVLARLGIRRGDVLAGRPHALRALHRIIGARGCAARRLRR